MTLPREPRGGGVPRRKPKPRRILLRSVMTKKKKFTRHERQQLVKQRTQRRKYQVRCKHFRENGITTAIAWMEHSGGHVMGVCKLCFLSIDSRTKTGARLLRLSGAFAQRTMGRVLPPEPPKPWQSIVREPTEESFLVDAREQQLATAYTRPLTLWESVKAIFRRMDARADDQQEG